TITVACASSPRRRAPTSPRRSMSRSTILRPAGVASTRASAPGTSPTRGPAAAGRCATSCPTRPTPPTPCSSTQPATATSGLPTSSQSKAARCGAGTVGRTLTSCPASNGTPWAARDSLRIGLSAPVEPPVATPAYGGAVGPDARRVGLYRSYDAPLDEGWTRWVFDTWHVPYVSVVDSVVRAGKLTERFDVLVLPDQSPNELLSGL